MYKNSMNTAVHPCDDYFDYACANYPFHNQIPPHMELWTYTSARKENVDRIVLGKVHWLMLSGSYILNSFPQ